MIVVVFGNSRKDVERLTKLAPVDRCIWKLASEFEIPIGHACFAPENPDIEDAYREMKLRVLKAPEVEAPKKKKKKKPVYSSKPKSTEPVRDRDE